ncbi:MAG TPA: YbdK family carboxylate-amine ligase [Solirubrobacteraceae bacterium]|nr:YbdK family carboxylate-amine ligase [Solirubrobacteraceae bacterium]
MPLEPPSSDALEALFDSATGYLVGIEEELMLLDPASLELVPKGPEVLGWVDGDERFKLELPASQIEVVTPPRATVEAAATELMAARHDLAGCTQGRVRIASAGVSPVGSGRGEVNASPRYQAILREYGPIAERQLVCALQVHVSIPGAGRALTVYNHARTYLPWVAALAANGRFYEGEDTGLASVRPKISELLPRHGIPPAFADWREYADALSWGKSAYAVPEPGAWWWELRPHPSFGTLEFRVPDSQPTVAQSAAVAAVIHALVVWLARRCDAGEQLPVASTWRLEENRWSACRYGVEGEMVDPRTGQRRRTRDCLEELLQALGPIAAELGASRALQQAVSMVQVNGAIRQRQVGEGGGAHAVAEWLVDRFLAAGPG